MHTVTIKHKLFRFYVEVPDPGDPTGRTMALKQVEARYGETVEIPRDEDYQEGLASGAFTTAADEAAAAPGEPLPGTDDIKDMSDSELNEFVEARRLGAPATIALSGDDPVLAQRLIDAEQAVTGRDPRASVIEGLQRVIDRHNEEEEED